MHQNEFRQLLENLALACNGVAPESASGYFSADAVYLLPPDECCLRGKDEIAFLFARLEPGPNLTWHHIWFDESSQTGAVEFTFQKEQAHGVAVIRVDEGCIRSADGESIHTMR